MHARLEEAHGRLRGCDAPEGLVSLACDCLEPLPKDRPKDAGVVAQRVADHLASVEERARQAELDTVHAASEARRAQRGRRTTVVLSAVALVAILGGGGGVYAWTASERARAGAAATKVAPLLLEATRGEGERDWAAAQAAAATALALAETEGADAETLATVRALDARIGAAAAAERARAEERARGTRLLDALDELRMQGTDMSEAQQDRGYGEAFAAFGVDPDGVAAAAALAGLDRSVELAVHLDRWAPDALPGGRTTVGRASTGSRARSTTIPGARGCGTPRGAETRRPCASSRPRWTRPGRRDPRSGGWRTPSNEPGTPRPRPPCCAGASSSIRRTSGSTTVDDALWWGLRRAPEAMPHAHAAVALRPQSGGAWNSLGAIRNDGLVGPRRRDPCLPQGDRAGAPASRRFHSQPPPARSAGRATSRPPSPAARGRDRPTRSCAQGHDDLGLALQEQGRARRRRRRPTARPVRLDPTTPGPTTTSAWR